MADAWKRRDPEPDHQSGSESTTVQPTDDDLAAGRARVAAAREEHRNWLENQWRNP
jgi:hypothetical protein